MEVGGVAMARADARHGPVVLIEQLVVAAPAVSLLEERQHRLRLVARDLEVVHLVRPALVPEQLAVGGDDHQAELVARVLLRIGSGRDEDVLGRGRGALTPGHAEAGGPEPRQGVEAAVAEMAGEQPRGLGDDYRVPGGSGLGAGVSAVLAGSDQTRRRDEQANSGNEGNPREAQSRSD